MMNTRRTWPLPPEMFATSSCWILGFHKVRFLNHFSVENYTANLPHQPRMMRLTTNCLCKDIGWSLPLLRDWYFLLSPCDAYILMYAVNSMSTFQDLCRAARQIPLNSKQNSKLNLILIGTKSDDKLDREVSYQDGFGLSQQLGCCAFYEVSAKMNDNVDEAVIELIKSLRVKRRSRRYPWTRLFRLLATSKSLGNSLQVNVSKPMRVM